MATKEDIETLKEVFATKDDLHKTEQRLKDDLRSVERNLIDRLYISERNLTDRVQTSELNSLNETSRAKLQVIIVIVVTAIIQPIISIIYKKMGL